MQTGISGKIIAYSRSEPFWLAFFIYLKIYSLVGNIKNDLVKNFMQQFRNSLIIDLINS